MYVFVYYSNLCICIPLYCMYVHIIVSVVGPNFDHDCIMVGERGGAIKQDENLLSGNAEY